MRINKLGATCFAVLLFFGCSLVARAQENGTQQANPQAQSGMHQRQHGNRLDWLSKQLNLTDEQKAKIKPILADEGKQMRTVREDTSLSRQQKHEKMMQLHETVDSQINDSPDARAAEKVRGS